MNTHYIAYVRGVVCLTLSACVVFAFFDVKFPVGLLNRELTRSDMANHILLHDRFDVFSPRLKYYVDYVDALDPGHII